MKHVHLIARILISAIFILSGINKVTNFSGTQEFVAGAGYASMAAFLVVLAIIAELFGGLSVLLGYKTKCGSLILVIFMVVATLMFHLNLSDQIQMIMFMKNLAIIGGLLYVWQHGAGAMSMDKK